MSASLGVSHTFLAACSHFGDFSKEPARLRYFVGR